MGMLPFLWKLRDLKTSQFKVDKELVPENLQEWKDFQGNEIHPSPTLTSPFCPVAAKAGSISSPSHNIALVQAWAKYLNHPEQGEELWEHN